MSDSLGIHLYKISLDDLLTTIVSTFYIYEDRVYLLYCHDFKKSEADPTTFLREISDEYNFLSIQSM